jgi:hypothetical protein
MAKQKKKSRSYLGKAASFAVGRGKRVEQAQDEAASATSVGLPVSYQVQQCPLSSAQASNPCDAMYGPAQPCFEVLCICKTCYVSASRNSLLLLLQDNASKQSSNTEVTDVSVSSVAVDSSVQGLHNLGNTCFFNSALQLLLACGPLHQLLLQDNHSLSKGPMGYALQQAVLTTSGA